MDVVTLAKRYLGFISILSLLLIAFGCSPRGVNYNRSHLTTDSGAQTDIAMGVDSSTTTSDVQVNYSSIDEFLGTRASNTESLSALDSSGIDIALFNHDYATQVLIRTIENDPLFEISRISNPSRVVIDLPGRHAGSNQGFHAGASSVLSQIRLGVHANKNRVVLDIAEDYQEASHQVDVIDGAIIVTLASDTEDLHAAVSDLDNYWGAPVPGNSIAADPMICLLYTSPSPRDRQKSRMPSSA